MKLEQFSVSIPEGVETNDGYVKIPHNTQYTIQLDNFNWSKRCAAEVKVDGKHVGTFRIGAARTLRLERPTHDSGRFTFYKDGTKEANKAGLKNVSREDRGLIQVTFKPEKYNPTPVAEVEVDKPWYPNKPWSQPYYLDGGVTRGFSSNSGDDALIGSPDVSPRYTKSLLRGPGGQSVSSGGTGLSGQSSQSFRTVGHLNYDESAFVTITLRLVASEEGPRPLTAVSPRATPVPRPV